MYRIGQGYDVHRLVDGRNFILGGVHIPYHQGLLGHSDADVLMHALIDAILGAAGMGDIGRMFPDTAPEYAGADSSILLQQCWAKVSPHFTIVNIDATVIAQKPKLAPHLTSIQNHLADCLGINVKTINIKAKTNEGLGYLGECLAVEAQTIVLLSVQP